MQLVIVHYHLNRGGVTSVIENHLRALALLRPDETPSRVAIFYGGRAAAWKESMADELPFECSLIAVPELEYDHLRSTAGQLYKALRAVLGQYDRNSTVVHVHNHSLGKNAAMAGVVCRLAAEGWRQLLQIHDFAEDLRPANYQHLRSEAESLAQMQGQLYPQAGPIHYAVLNERDEQVLAQAGIAGERLHRLPNPVGPMQRSPDDTRLQTLKTDLKQSLGWPADHRFVLYPVRPIRRKNVGEFLLWSLLAEKTTFALTLAPLNPQEAAVYQRWVDLAAELQLPVSFEIAGKTALPYEDIYAVADAIITTSVAEGFGMAYLEAALAGHPLVGRRLPGVCSDFVAAGMKFPGLTDAMAIPTGEIDLEGLKQTHVQLLGDLRKAYGLPAAETAEIQTVENFFLGDTVDFGRLESSQQARLLRRVKCDPELRRAVQELNPTLQMIGAVADEDFESALATNRRVIAQNYSPEVIGERLRGIYRAVLASPRQPVVCEPRIASAILDRFVHPRQLFPVRVES